MAINVLKTGLKNLKRIVLQTSLQCSKFYSGI